MDRRDFVGNTLASVAVAATQGTPLRTQRPAGFSLEEKTIAELQEQMTAGRATSRHLVDQYAARIAALDQRGPRLNHVLEVNPEARAIADQLDQERRAGHVRGPLHGIPVLIKDNIATADRME